MHCSSIKAPCILQQITSSRKILTSHTDLSQLFCCCCLVTKSHPTLWPHGLKHSRLPCPSLSPGLLKLMSIELMMPSNHLILCRPLLLLSSIFPSIRVFANESVLRIRWPKYWNLNFHISPSNECSELISFRMDWFDLPAVQRTLSPSELYCNADKNTTQDETLSHPRT